MDVIKQIKGCDVILKGNIMSFNYVFLKVNLNDGDHIPTFGSIKNCIA